MSDNGKRQETDGSAGTADELVEQLLNALPDWFAVTGRLSELVAENIGIGATDLQCLHFLNRNGPSSAGELARRVGRSTGAVTRMIDRLERADFVERRASGTDRRAVVVHATTAGIDRIASYFDDVAAQTRADLAHHTIRELQVLLRFVNRGTDNATAQMRRIAAH
jgi:DNA-binding MarR family transcriptional regulator